MFSIAATGYCDGRKPLWRGVSENLLQKMNFMSIQQSPLYPLTWKVYEMLLNTSQSRTEYLLHFFTHVVCVERH